MSNLSPWRNYRYILVPLVALIMLSGFGAYLLLHYGTAKASATNVPVILLHGLEGYNTSNCNTTTTKDSSGNYINTYDRWGGFYQVNNAHFDGLYWDPSLIHTVGYYNGDYSCSDYLGTDSNYPKCQNYYDTYNASTRTGSNEQTNNEDIRHIACRFYWWLYNNYTARLQPVNLLAHSMGGLVLDWALAKAGHDPTFPYPLYVYNVVTLSTPFNGIPGVLDAGSNLACNGCAEGKAMQQGTDFMNAIQALTTSVGYWTLIGEYDDVAEASCDVVNFNIDSAVEPGPNLASAQTIEYEACIQHEEAYPGAVFVIGGTSSSYQDDASTSLDWRAYTGTPSNLMAVEALNYAHPLAKAIDRLGVTRGPDQITPTPTPIPPTPTVAPGACPSHPNDANCDGQDFGTQGCNAYPQSQVYNDSVVNLTLYYSTNCQSNWTEATIVNSNYALSMVSIVRVNTLNEAPMTLADAPSPVNNIQAWHTKMIWAPTNPAYSCVRYKNISTGSVSSTFCTPWSPVYTTCKSAPNQTNCNNKDVNQQGCNDYPQGSATSNGIVSILIHWSTNCQSNWGTASMINTNYTIYQVVVNRQAVSGGYGAASYSAIPPYPQGDTNYYSPMVWSPSNPAQACVYWLDGNTPKIYGPLCTGWH